MRTEYDTDTAFLYPITGRAGTPLFYTLMLRNRSSEAMAAFQENHNRICPILDFPIPDYPTSENPMQLNKEILNTNC